MLSLKKYGIGILALWALLPTGALGSQLTPDEVIQVCKYCTNLAIGEKNIQIGIGQIQTILDDELKNPNSQDSTHPSFLSNQNFRADLLQVIIYAKNALEKSRVVKNQHLNALLTNSDEALDTALEFTRPELAQAQSQLQKTYDLLLNHLLEVQPVRNAECEETLAEESIAQESITDEPKNGK